MIILQICNRNLRKISCKTFHRKSYFTYFLDFVYHHFSKIVWGNKFPFPTWSRPFDFSISNELFAFKTEILSNWVAKKITLDLFQIVLFHSLTTSKSLVLNVVPITAGQYLWKSFTLSCYKLIIFSVSMHF